MEQLEKYRSVLSKSCLLLSVFIFFCLFFCLKDLLKLETDLQMLVQSGTLHASHLPSDLQVEL